MSERKPSPREFPLMRPPRAARKAFPRRSWAVCPVCHLAIDPRMRERHRKACQRRKRLAPELWLEWKRDMQTGWD